MEYDFLSFDLDLSLGNRTHVNFVFLFPPGPIGVFEGGVDKESKVFFYGLIWEFSFRGTGWCTRGIVCGIGLGRAGPGDGLWLAGCVYCIFLLLLPSMLVLFLFSRSG